MAERAHQHGERGAGRDRAATIQRVQRVGAVGDEREAARSRVEQYPSHVHQLQQHAHVRVLPDPVTLQDPRVPYQLPRVRVHRATTLAQFAASLNL